MISFFHGLWYLPSLSFLLPEKPPSSESFVITHLVSDFVFLVPIPAPDDSWVQLSSPEAGEFEPVANLAHVKPECPTVPHTDLILCVKPPQTKKSLVFASLLSTLS